MSDPQFKTKGIIHIDIDSATAWAMLTPTPQVNGELNFDTTISVECHDGHTGKSIQRWAVTVNIAPAITTVALPPAKEGIDYSLNFTDPNLVNRILVFDQGALIILFREISVDGLADAATRAAYLVEYEPGHIERSLIPAGIRSLEL